MARYTYEGLAKSSESELKKIMQEGVTPKFEDLVGWEFRGWNVPYITRILGFQKFKKGFYLGPNQRIDGREISGYNVVVVQNRFDEPWIAKPSEDAPKRHGFYIVYKVRPEDKDNLFQNALLLNYGLGKNPLWHPARLLRDYLVQPDPDNRDLFLGMAVFAIGPFRVFPSFFIIERYNQSNFKLM